MRGGEGWERGGEERREEGRGGWGGREEGRKIFNMTTCNLPELPLPPTPSHSNTHPPTSSFLSPSVPSRVATCSKCCLASSSLSLRVSCLTSFTCDG